MTDWFLSRLGPRVDSSAIPEYQSPAHVTDCDLPLPLRIPEQV
jgi:hypothetical protein